MQPNAAEIVDLVREETDHIRDPAILEGLSRMLVSPWRRSLAWDYGSGDETYPAWMVAEDPTSGTGIAWCGHGFGPKAPWGLVSLATDSMGMDSGWYPTLREAYLESFAAGDLHIWVVVRRDDPGHEMILSGPTNMHLAFRWRDEQPDPHSYDVLPRHWTHDRGP